MMIATQDTRTKDVANMRADLVDYLEFILTDEFFEVYPSYVDVTRSYVVGRIDEMLEDDSVYLDFDVLHGKVLEEIEVSTAKDFCDFP